MMFGDKRFDELLDDMALLLARKLRQLVGFFSKQELAHSLPIAVRRRVHPQWLAASNWTFFGKTILQLRSLITELKLMSSLTNKTCLICGC